MGGDQTTYDNVGASKQAIQYHYDVGNDFYAALLGPTMCYSAALWLEDPATDTLDAAQRRKLDWHIRASGADQAAAVLDVGCGWGSALARAVEIGSPGRAVGLTLSDAQAEWIGERHRKLEAHVTEWQGFESDETFEAIISIGAFEHFVSPEHGGDEKIATYRDFFRFCESRLAPGGKLSLQTIAWQNIDPADELTNLPEEMFPDSNLPHLAEIVTAAGDVLDISHLGAHASDYAHTLRRWSANLRGAQPALAQRYGADLMKRYRRSFTSFTLGFNAGIITLYRIVLEKKP